VEGPVPEQPASITIDPVEVAAIEASLTPLPPPAVAPTPEATAERPVSGVGPTGAGPEDIVPGAPAPLDSGPPDAASTRGIAERFALFNGIDFASGQYAYPTPTLPALVRLIVAGTIDLDLAQFGGLTDYQSSAAIYFERGL
jgi:hypothetical protein